MLASLIASLASGEAVLALRRARRAAIVYLIALAALLCGTGFLIGAGYIWLAQRYGSLQASIAFGVGFIVIAMLVLLVDKLTAKAQTRRAAVKRKSDFTALGVAAAIGVLPGLLRSRAGIGALIAPVIAVTAYAIYRENRDSRPPVDRRVD